MSKGASINQVNSIGVEESGVTQMSNNYGIKLLVINESLRGISLLESWGATFLPD